MLEKAFGGGSGRRPSGAGQKARFPPPGLIEDGSEKGILACGRLNSISACEADINDVTGWDTEQEQATPGCVRVAPKACPDWDPIRIRAPFAVMRHVPPCMQQPQVQTDWHDTCTPLTNSDIWKEPHRPRPNSSVQKKPLITFLPV